LKIDLELEASKPLYDNIDKLYLKLGKEEENIKARQSKKYII